MFYILLVFFILFYLLNQTALLPLLIIGFNLVVDRLIIPFVKPALIVLFLALVSKFILNNKLQCPWKPCSGIECIIRAWHVGIEEYKKCIKEKRKQKKDEESHKKYKKDEVVSKIIKDNTYTETECSCDESSESEITEPIKKHNKRYTNDPVVLTVGTQGASIRQVPLGGLIGGNVSLGGEFVTRQCEECK